MVLWREMDECGSDMVWQYDINYINILMKRLNLIADQVSGKNTITITDSRTGKTHELNTNNGFIKSGELAKLTHKGKVLRSYDPGYMNTITCTSTISFIDGEKGILEYRGYPIEDLAEKCSFLEVAYLVIWGELPTQRELSAFSKKVMEHTFVHEDLLGMMTSFRYDAHPMGMLCSAVAALSTLHPEQNPSLVGESVYKNKKIRNKQIYRLLGCVPTIAANAYRHRIGREYNKPHENFGYVENFLYMLDRLNEKNYKPHPKLVKALEILFILHAEHELNCSTAAVRHLASSGVDVYTAIAGATGALYGPKHGGANEAVLRMLEQIGKKENIPQFIESVKNRKSLLYGFGHRVYKNYDPRAKIIKKVADDVFEIVGKEGLIEIAIELERIALSDPYFIERKLYPNVDFYSGIIYKALGFPTDMFPVLLMIPRTVGWLAHWNEFLDDPENKIIRPRQHYVGHNTRNYVPADQREEHKFNIDCSQTPFYKRNIVSTVNQ
jgi:citrate synthase